MMKVEMLRVAFQYWVAVAALARLAPATWL